MIFPPLLWGWVSNLTCVKTIPRDPVGSIFGMRFNWLPFSLTLTIPCFRLFGSFLRHAAIWKIYPYWFEIYVHITSYWTGMIRSQPHWCYPFQLFTYRRVWAIKQLAQAHRQVWPSNFLLYSRNVQSFIYMLIMFSTYILLQYCDITTNKHLDDLTILTFQFSLNTLCSLGLRRLRQLPRLVLVARGIDYG